MVRRMLWRVIRQVEAWYVALCAHLQTSILLDLKSFTAKVLDMNVRTKWYEPFPAKKELGRPYFVSVKRMLVKRS